MGEILGNPGHLDKGVSSLTNPRMLLGWGRYLGIPGYLDKGGGVSSSPHPRMLLGWGRYLGMFQEWGRYVLKGEVATSLHPRMFPGNGLGSEWHSVPHLGRKLRSTWTCPGVYGHGCHKQ